MKFNREKLFNYIIKRNKVTNFNSLVELQVKSCTLNHDRNLFGKNSPNIKWTSYSQWNDNIKLFRTVLHNLNLNHGDKVAIISSNKEEWAVSAYATYSIGGVFVPMYPTQREKDWKYILNDSNSKTLIFTDPKLSKTCESLLNNVKSLKNVIYLNDNYQELYNNLKFFDGPKIKYFFEEKNVFFPDENDLATIIYTSGTTGNPKGVKLTHKNLVSNLKGIQDSFSDFDKISNQNDRSISFLPWAHCYGQTCELHGLISTGSSMYLSEGIDKLIDEINVVKPTLLFSVPTLFNKVYDTINKNLSKSKLKRSLFDDALETSKKVRNDRINKNNRINEFHSTINKIKYNIYDKILFSKIREKLGGKIKHSFVGGAATPVEVLEFFENINIPIIEGYGLSETSPIITLGSLEYPDRKLGCVGKPLPGNDVIIVNGNKKQEPNKEGEILASGENIMDSYHNIDDSDVFINIDNKRYFKTGDLGYLDEMNRLHLTGRIKEQYKLENGKFVVPTLIESCLILSPYIKQIVVYGENKPYNIALIVPDRDKLEEDNLNSENADLDQFYLEEINLISKNKIKNYEIPKKVLILNNELTIESGFLTPKMSIKRSKVIDYYNKDLINLY